MQGSGGVVLFMTSRCGGGTEAGNKKRVEKRAAYTLKKCDTAYTRADNEGGIPAW